MTDAALHVFGIRHHGPGSARSLRAALDALKPDLILIEGPPEADAVIKLAGHKDMQPPVALLLYSPDEPRRAHYFPFAVFSPEWIALRWALSNKVSVRFMDLPVSHQLALEAEAEAAAAAAFVAENDDAESSPSVIAERVRHDPLSAVASAAGYDDGERWWEHMVEERQDHAGAFDAVLEVMTALREDDGAHAGNDPREEGEKLFERRREAWMRRTVRSARGEKGVAKLAVVCGAWHAPAILGDVAVADDDATLKGLPKMNVRATWIPWNPERLARESGYGAGVPSPGWYAHVWEHGVTADATINWMTRVGRMLREEGVDASPAQTIDAVRLASTLSALRGRPVPGLPELTESTLAALLDGNELPLALVRRRLIIGETLGVVPEGTPTVPLQESLAQDQKRLRMPPEASEKILELDLRKPLDLERSVLLHRLTLLGVAWGAGERGGGKGTFKEVWRLAWSPELAVAVIEAATWGNTVESAATARAADLTNKANDLSTLAQLLGQLLVADVPAAARLAIARLDALAAVSADFAELCGALPPVARTLRYGDVRGTDSELLTHVVRGLVVRITAGLPPACASLDDDAAGTMYVHLIGVNDALARLEDAALLEDWREALGRIVAMPNVHGLVAGRCARLLLDAGALDASVAATQWSAALSRGADHAAGAAFVEGFLRDSGTLLVHDHKLWTILDEWIDGLAPEAFSIVLPLLRRTVGTFTAPERRRLGERAKSAAAVVSTSAVAIGDASFDHERAAAVLPTLALMLGLDGKQKGKS